MLEKNKRIRAWFSSGLDAVLLFVAYLLANHLRFNYLRFFQPGGAGPALDIAQGFVTVRNVAGAVAWILILMLLIISLFIIANTIKLATFHRREEIAIMKMCGATNWFVRWPFIFEGMLLGLIGALVAFLLQWGIYSLIVTAITEYGGLQLIAIVPFKTLALRVLGAFAAAGLAIGAGGSLLAIRKFLQV